MVDHALLFVEGLGENDLELLTGSIDAGMPPRELRRHLADDPSRVGALLADRRVFDSLFEVGGPSTIRVLTPLLVFGVLVHRTIVDLESSSHVPEWVGAGERLPVFDVASLLDFIGGGEHRHIIIDLLASFTSVASGTVWVMTSRGYRRRRFSELDPVSLAEMVEGLPRERQPAGYRRLGDLALFLTGVFPDHTDRHPVSPMQRARIAGSIGITSPEGVGNVEFLEAAGRGWYGRAARSPYVGGDITRDLAENFTLARRFLNLLADNYLHRLDTGLMSPI